MSGRMTDPQLDYWRFAGPIELSEPTRALFEEYSGIDHEELTQHILKIRDEAWKLFPYPCIGTFAFLNFNVTYCPPYDEVLSRLKDGHKLIDLGCCFGQDIRKLIFDGAPRDNVRGFELHKEFIDLGFELFRDKSKLTSNFMHGDFFDPDSALKDTEGTLDIVYSSSFFHLFNWENQVKAISRAVRLLRPKPGSLIFGLQMGSFEAGIFDHAAASDAGGMYRHNADSFRKLWDEVSQITNMKFDVQVEVDVPPEWNDASTGNDSDGIMRLRYAVYIK